MFILSEFMSTVRIPPWKFDSCLNDAVTEELNKKLANKVVHKTGLCISLYDILSLEDSFIFPGDGASHTKVSFRFVVFRPFLDEIVIGRIKGCSQEGVHVTLGFFDDILIPADSLPHPSRFDFSEEREQLWVWEYSMDGDKHDLFMDIGEEIRFKVVDEIFVDTSPTGPDLSEISTGVKKVPYTILGSIGEAGLGLLSWWTN